MLNAIKINSLPRPLISTQRDILYLSIVVKIEGNLGFDRFGLPPRRLPPIYVTLGRRPLSPRTSVGNIEYRRAYRVTWPTLHVPLVKIHCPIMAAWSM